MIENLLHKATTTSNIELNKIGKKLMGSAYVGTFMSDEIPTLLNEQCCIINIQSSRQDGLHWCGLKKYKNRYYFYDAYTRNPKTLSRYWKSKKWIYGTHKKIDESNYSTDCGELSMAYLYTTYMFPTNLVLKYI